MTLYGVHQGRVTGHTARKGGDSQISDTAGGL